MYRSRPIDTIVTLYNIELLERRVETGVIKKNFFKNSDWSLLLGEKAKDIGDMWG